MLYNMAAALAYDSHWRISTHVTSPGAVLWPASDYHTRWSDPRSQAYDTGGGRGGGHGDRVSTVRHCARAGDVGGRGRGSSISAARQLVAALVRVVTGMPYPPMDAVVAMTLCRHTALVGRIGTVDLRCSTPHTFLATSLQAQPIASRQGDVSGSDTIAAEAVETSLVRLRATLGVKISRRLPT